MKLRIIPGSLLLLLITLTAPAWSDIVNIFELTEGIPTVQVLDANGDDVTTQRVMILGDSYDGYLYDAQENGQLQHVADAFNTNIDDGSYIFFAQSDVDAITPEPMTLVLLATGLTGGLARRKFLA
jgi:hypothetical protein